MIALESTERQIAVSQFKAHCTEELRVVEEEGITLVITRHGKAVAKVTRPEQVNIPTIAEWIGSGRKFSIASNEVIDSFDLPTWTPQDWEQHPGTSFDSLEK